MTPLGASALSWLAGAAVGAAASRQHKIAGAMMGALIVGAVADVMIDRRAWPFGKVR